MIMATMFVGQLPPKENIGSSAGAGIGAGLVKGYDEMKRQEDAVFAVTVKMYQDATPEDRALLEKSPGWGKVVEMAQKRGIPLVKSPSGGMGFVSPIRSLEQQKAMEAASFPGETRNFAGQPGWDPSQPTTSLPPGVAGYEARQKAIEAEATGERPLRSAQAGYYGANTRQTEAETGFLPQKWGLEERKVQTDESRLQLSREQFTDEMSFKRAQMQQEKEIWNKRLAMMARELGTKAGAAEDQNKSLKGYTEFVTRMGKYKTDLRQQMKMADRQQTINHAFGDYMNYRSTVDMNDPYQVQGFIGATTDTVFLLLDELTSQPQGGTQLDAARRQNLLDVINEAQAKGILPQEITVRVNELLRSAGFQKKGNWWLMPAEPKGLWSTIFGGGNDNVAP